MVLIFESKHTGEHIEVTDVKYFTTDAEWLSTKGYSVHYNDGTFNLYGYSSWKLAMAKSDKEDA